jgi:CDP-4-dehydro-6-deoxyglucose reductase
VRQLHAQLVAAGSSYPSGKTDALEGQPADACLTCQAVPETDCTLRVAELETVADIEVRTLPCRIAREDPAQPRRACACA